MVLPVTTLQSAALREVLGTAQLVYSPPTYNVQDLR
jgi:hypothetical protein